MTSFLNICLLMLYVSVSVAGLTLVKLGEGIADPKSWLGFLLYGAGFVLWFVFLMRLPLSRAFPVAAGCLIIGTQAAGWYFLKEKLSASQLAGIVAILIGVVLIFQQD